MNRSSCIFLPGFMCDGRLFDAQKRALEVHGHACMDGVLTSAETIEGLAAAVLHTAPETFAVIGLSMGGIVALELVRQAPQRISHIALLNTTHRADRARAKRMAQLERVNRGELSLVLRDELKPIYMHPSNRLPDRLELLSRMAEALGERVFERQTKALMQRSAYTETLADIACPSLVLTGEDDTVCPPDLHHEIAEAIPEARLTLIPQCGHLSTLERPDIVSEALLDLLARQL